MGTVAYAGLTHLGLVYAASAAKKGFDVIAYDEDAGLVDSIASGRLPVEEPGLAEAYREHRGSMRLTSDPRALAAADLIYISADVPTDERGSSDLARTRVLIEVASASMRDDALLTVLCQVPPGFMRTLQFPRQRLFYQVETLVFGQALERAFSPERHIVGCSEPERPLPEKYERFLAHDNCPVLRMRYESAELTKIAINCCLVASVSVANTLAELCERIGADWAEIAPALRSDRRIGQYAYLKPGLGIAGGNLERDLATIERLAEQHGTDSSVVRAWMQNSRRARDWAARTIKRALLAHNPDALVAVWGLAYKENTHSIKNSPSIATLLQLPDARFRVHDPVVSASVVKHRHVELAADPLSAARGADALMILTPWPQYRAIPAVDLAHAMRGRLILDPYAVLEDASARQADLQVLTLGRAAEPTETARHA